MRKTIDPITRLLNRVEINTETGCWEWQGRTCRGYGSIGLFPTGEVKVHRLMYERLVGPIPAGLVIDHLCRVRNCVNPEHLEPVTRQENNLRGVGWSGRNARKTHCPQGHEYTPENTAVRRGQRCCLECDRIKSRAKHAKRRARRDAAEVVAS